MSGGRAGGRWLAGCTGRGVRVAVVDSGVHGDHPHVGGIVGGVSVMPGEGAADALDRLGHGTAVAAAIREKAPDVELVAVKIFDRVLATDVGALLRGLETALELGARLVNLSVGTSRREHAGQLADMIARARAAGATIVSPRAGDGLEWLPGCLPGVVAVELDWTRDRETYGVREEADGAPIFLASGYPRDIPGVPRERNLKGVSFAAANMTGFAARALEADPGASFERLIERLREAAA